MFNIHSPRFMAIVPLHTFVTKPRDASAIHNLKSEYEHFDTISEGIFCSPWIKQSHNKPPSADSCRANSIVTPRDEMRFGAPHRFTPMWELPRSCEREPHSTELRGMSGGAGGMYRGHAKFRLFLRRHKARGRPHYSLQRTPGNENTQENTFPFRPEESCANGV